MQKLPPELYPHLLSPNIHCHLHLSDNCHFLPFLTGPLWSADSSLVVTGALPSHICWFGNGHFQCAFTGGESSHLITSFNPHFFFYRPTLVTDCLRMSGKHTHTVLPCEPSSDRFVSTQRSLRNCTNCTLIVLEALKTSSEHQSWLQANTAANHNYMSPRAFPFPLCWPMTKALTLCLTNQRESYIGGDLWPG